MLEYVFPHCQKNEKEIEKIKGISRLYAYPCEPHFENESKIVILDSGAFGLSRYGAKITLPYMIKLSAHYEKFAKSNTLCIAPDEFLNPVQTMKNFRTWQRNNLFSKITPVLQRSVKKIVNIDELKMQAEYYREYSDTVCVANAGMYGHEALLSRMDVLLRYIKKDLDYQWIHILGAGYSIEDIDNWKKVGNFDSLDSRAYFITKDINAFGSFSPTENIRRIIECSRK